MARLGLVPQHSLQSLYSTGVSSISIVLDLEKVLPMSRFGHAQLALLVAMSDKR